MFVDGKKAGDGYCTGGPCHVEVSFKERSEEWNFRFEHDHNTLLVTRSVRNANELVACDEKLTLQKPIVK